MTMCIRTLPRPFRATQAALLLIAVLSSACAGHTPRSGAKDPATVDISQLWIEPRAVEPVTLYYGEGGRERAPDPDYAYNVIKIERSGYSPGYKVRDANGLEWDVKTGPEAQTEVAVSRILWALGYHQPPIYLVGDLHTAGGDAQARGAARFRPSLPDWKLIGDWSWYENDFMDTMPYKGLVAINMVLNNWDWKTSNNKIYEVRRSDGSTSRVYVVRDIGASLGKTSFPTLLKWTPMRGMGQGSRNNLEDFEEQGFIKGMDGARVKFDYRGIHQSLVDTLTVEQVLWACRLMSRLSDGQYDAAFRAAGYPDDVRRRYVAKIKSKIGEGLALQGS